MRDLYDELHDDGFEMLRISMDQDIDRVRAFADEHGMTWPVVCSGMG